MLDEKLVEGQIIGAVVDGIGGTMLAEIVYDDEGQLLTGSLADYMVATAAEAPRVRLDHISTLPTTNPLCVRGVGEGGIIPVAPAIVNAISRALVPPGTVPPAALFRLPLTPETVLEAIESLAERAT
jgi:carbon-monoxide dehydrogenase large subunit